MAARIVYDGVGGGGNLFEGTTFHVHQRVPMRTSIIQKIEANGGAIHPLEKGANIIIADCARKDCPPGSVSWKYIEQSVRKGKLEDIEDYPASKLPRETNGTRAPAATSPSTSRPAQLRRVGRMPFSHEDDKVLMEFCTRKERAGAQLKGNVIFQELEQINPRHTSQSWRDRWVKYLQDRPRPTLDDEEDEEDEDEEPAPSRAAPKSKVSRSPPKLVPKSSKIEPARTVPKTSAAKPSPQKPKAGLSKTSLRASTTTPVAARNPSPSKGSEFRPYLETSKGGKHFTDEETELLFDVYDSIMDIDEEQMIDAWIAWSVSNPNHTPQEWRNHFNSEVRGKKPASKKAKRKPTPVSSPALSSRSARSRDKGKGRATEDNVPPVSSTREVKDSQGSSNNTIKSPENLQSSEVSAGSEEERFKINFSKMAEILLPERFKEGIDFYPYICDIPVPLFEIWDGAYALGGPAELNSHNRWPDLAEKLTFLKSQWKRAGGELKVICCDLLLIFEESLNQLRDVSDSQADQEIDEQLRIEANEAAQRYYSSQNGEEEDDDEDDDDDLNAAQSSSFVKFGVKRISPDNTTPANKRQKLDKGKGRAREISEIPSTPEDIINSHKRKSPFKPSPLKQAPFQPDEGLDDEEPSLFIPERSPTPVKQAPKPRMLDPHTQDFHFQDSLPKEADPEEVPDEEEEDDQEDHPIISPTPLRSKRLPIHSTDRSNPSSTNATRNSGPSQTGSSTQSQNVSQQNDSYEEFVERCMALGYNVKQIGEALETTSITLGPISMIVMQSLKEGNGIPEHQKEVWTPHDDEVLKLWKENPDSKRNKMKMHKLVLKHGKDSIKRRKKYLRSTEDE